MTDERTPATTEDPEFHLPEHHSPLPQLLHVGPDAPRPSGASFSAVMASPTYERLRATFRGFAFPMTIAGLTSYFVYVVLSIYAPNLMGTPAFGALNWGLVIGLAQFAVTWIWTAAYVRFANHKLDAVAADLKNQLENGAQA